MPVHELSHMLSGWPIASPQISEGLKTAWYTQHHQAGSHMGPTVTGQGVMVGVGARWKEFIVRGGRWQLC